MKTVLGRAVLVLFGLPVLAIYWLLAFCIACVASLLVVPTQMAARRLNWALPFLPYVWRQNGWLVGSYLRLSFECSYFINLTTRLLTLPIRRAVPDFYIVGFPKAGTTSLATYLKLHPALSTTAGLPFHEASSKESHYFAGILGPGNAYSARLYSCCFPTLMHKWWAEVIRGVDKWMCFDACPVYASLPYAADRIAAVTPNAKIIFMLRDPVEGVFSAEIMMRNMGCPLEWSLMEEVRDNDPRFQVHTDEQKLWQQLTNLQPTDPLPPNMPELFYFRLGSYLRTGQIPECIEKYLQRFSPENILFIDFKEFIQNTEEVVLDVLKFVGADPARYTFKRLPPGMKTDYKGRQMHPTMQRALREYFAPSNKRLAMLLKRTFSWNADADV